MTDVQEVVAAERRELADLLAGLRDEDWDAPSLCKGWRVREVVAHLTMPYRYSVARVLLGLLRTRGDFNKLADRAARQDAENLTADELVAVLRANIHHPWTPPGDGPVGALSHDVIHGLDITVALGIDRRVPLDRLQLVLGGIKSKNLKYFGTDLHDVVLRADDLDWSFGSGKQELSGSAQDLLLVLCGRKLPPGRVSGAPSSRFTTA